MTKRIKLLQKSIKVKVDFYDEEQKKKLLAYPTGGMISDIVNDGIEIPIDEFLTYYLFYRKRPGKPGYQSYAEIATKISKALYDLEDFISFNGNSISTASDVGQQDNHITERVGESIGLSVINRIHNLTAADWDRIESMGLKVFDYGIASDGKVIVQVETKGSSVNNNSLKPSTVSQHKASIISKKNTISELEKQNVYPYPANLRYGTIGVLDSRAGSTVRCLLVDPDPEFMRTPPEKLKLINRMRFLRDWLAFISPRSQMASSLSTRVSDLAILSDPFELDNRPLLKATGHPFDFVPTPDGNDSTLSFLLNKSRVIDGPSSGIVLQLSKNELFYAGIRDEIAILASKQNFRNVFEYKTDRATLRKAVQCLIPENTFQRFHLPEWFLDRVTRKNNHVSFRLDGDLQYSQEGLVFGVLPIDR